MNKKNEKTINRVQRFIQCKWLRRTMIYGLCALVLFTLLGFFAVPPLIRWVAQDQLTQLLGRKVTIEKVLVNPLTLNASVQNVVIAEPDGKTPFLTIGRTFVDFKLSSIYYLGAVISEAQIEHLVLNVARENEQNRYNFSDILDRFAAMPKKKEDKPSEPARFSLNNLQLIDSQITFDDKPMKQRHTIEHLNIGVPFMSNLPEQVASFVTPRLEAVINGTPLKLQGKVLPFATHREADLELHLAPFDIKRYLNYSPQKLPVRVDQALLGVDLRLIWSDALKNKPASLKLEGSSSLEQVKLSEESGAPLLAFDKLMVTLGDTQPLANPPLIHIKRIVLQAPALDISRAENGVINLLHVSEQAKADAKPAKAEPSQAKPASAPLDLKIDETVLHAGTLRWSDAAVPGGFKAVLTPVEIFLKDFTLNESSPASFNLQATADKGGAFATQGTVVLKDGVVDAHLAMDKLPLAAYHPYYQQALQQTAIDGLLKAETNVTVRFKQGERLTLTTKEGQAELTQFAMAPSGANSGANKQTAASDHTKKSPKNASPKGGPQPIVTWQTLAVSGAQFDLAKRSLDIAKVSSNDAHWVLIREKNGSINLPALGEKDTATSHKPVPATRDALAERPVLRTIAGESSAPFSLHVGEVQLASWSARYEDRTGEKPVVLQLDKMAFNLKEYSTIGIALSDIDLSAQVNKKGRLSAKGKLGLTPLKGNLKLDLNAVELLAAQPYVDKMYRVLITQGALSLQGDLAFDMTHPEQPQVRYNGQLKVANFNSLDQVNTTDFVRWKNLSLANVHAQLSPLVFETSEIRLESFYSRLILSANGQLNLREIAGGVETGGASTIPATQSISVGQSQPVQIAQGSKPDSAINSTRMAIKIARVVLNDGNIAYSDRFIKPNFDANLTGVKGELKNLSSDQTSIADLTLNAKVDDSAPVDVAGQLNPFRQDRYLDIRVHVADVELTGMSTYATKYVGYSIDKGKLSMNLAYQIRDRKLEAQNQVILDQLTFGKHVDSPDATQLPVLFVVSLLKDRNGVIDINLPISGTLDDPDFSIGGIIIRVIVNLLTKAVTSPFALIGSMFGGHGEELSFIEFDPGSVTLSKTSIDKLTTIAKALNDKPALKLEMTGHADAAVDESGLRSVQLGNQMRAIKARGMVDKGQAVEAVNTLQITPGERGDLLKQVYDNAKFDKPKNAIGLTKSLPPEEMEKLLLAHMPSGQAELTALANQRAQAIRSWLSEQGKVPAERMFILAPDASGSANKAADQSAESAQSGVQATPSSASNTRNSRVDFSLK